jgi:hypothetical protein
MENLKNSYYWQYGKERLQNSSSKQVKLIIVLPGTLSFRVQTKLHCQARLVSKPRIIADVGVGISCTSIDMLKVKYNRTARISKTQRQFPR